MQTPKPTQADLLPQDLINIDSLYIHQRVLSNTMNGQGKVFLVQKDNIPYAAKVFVKAASFREEVTILQLIKNIENTTQIVHQNEHAQILMQNGTVQIRPVIVMPIAEHGDLCDFIDEANKYYIKLNKIFLIPIPIAKTFFYQMLQALDKVHKRGIVHADIKFQNFLFDSDFNVILADFGLGYRIGKQGQSIKRGTPNFMAPQVELGQQISPASDIFISSKLFYKLCFGRYPFISPSEAQNFKQFNITENKKILQRKWQSYQQNLKIQIPSEIKTFFAHVFKRQPKLRPTITDIFQSGLFLNRASPAIVKQFMLQLYSLCMADNPKVQTIKAMIGQLRERRQAQQVLLAQQAENQQGLEVPEGQIKRKISKSKPKPWLQNYYKSYVNTLIAKQTLETRKPQKCLTPLKCNPLQLIGWLHYYLEHCKKSQNLILSSLLTPQQSLDYNISLINNNTSICIHYSITNTIDDDIPDIHAGVEGKICRVVQVRETGDQEEETGKFCIDWSLYQVECHKEYSEMVLREMREACLVIAVVQGFH